MKAPRSTVPTFLIGFACGLIFSNLKSLYTFSPFVLEQTQQFLTFLPTEAEDFDNAESGTDSVYDASSQRFMQERISDTATPDSIPTLSSSASLSLSSSSILGEAQSSTSLSNEKYGRPIALPASIGNFVHSMGRVERSSFARKFDTGYGLDPGSSQNSDVLLLYGSENSLPNGYNNMIRNSTDAVPAFADVETATENCDVLKLVLTDPRSTKKPRRGPADPHKQCIAIMGQWSSYHVQKWERAKEGRSLKYTPAWRPELPSREETETAYAALQGYLTQYKEAMANLEPLVKQAAYGNDGQLGPVIVMVANTGQAKFFMNFVCNAKSRGLDISRVLLFATDEDTYRLAKGMGVTTFYDEKIFGAIPTGAAKDYHDVNYGRIMMSKVYCVHLVNALGHDLLFQDVDLVWYRDPLPYFAKKLAETDPFDMYFQHDGDHHPERFAPLAANTGFYYVRHNERTEHFFSVFVRMGDLVLTDRSHQAALTTLANEHMSLRGLRVKVLEEDNTLFLSGYHYHARKQLMNQVVHGTHVPYIFHANWLPGNEKLPTLKRTLNWYLASQCMETESGNDAFTTRVTTTMTDGGGFTNACCRALPDKNMTTI